MVINELTEAEQIEAVERDPYAVCHFDHPTAKAYRRAVELEPLTLARMPNPPKWLCLEVFKEQYRLWPFLNALSDIVYDTALEEAARRGKEAEERLLMKAGKKLT